MDEGASIEEISEIEAACVKANPDPYADVPDETLAERLYGLTEMFPESLTNGACKGVQLSKTGAGKLYRFTRSALWILGTSFVVLGLPVIMEVEKVQSEEAQLMQQRQILLGPGAAGAGGGQAPPLNLQPQRR